MNKPLTITLPLVPGEALSGYVSRTAKFYETTPRDFCSDLGMKWPALCSGHDSQLTQLSWLLGIPVKELQDHCIRTLTHAGYQVGRTQTTKGVITRTSGQLCPKCVVAALDCSGPKGVFHLLEWSLTCVHVCFVHRYPLIQLPKAGNSHIAYDFASRVLQHKSLIMVAAEASANLMETPFETYVRKRVHKGPKKDWLYPLDLTQLHRCCITLGASLAGYKSVPFIKLPKEEDRSLCELGFGYLNKGPLGLRTALEKSFHKDRSKRPYVCSDMGPFYRWLHKFHTDPALTKLVEITRKHIFETYPASLEKEVFGQRPHERQLYTMADARIRTGLGTTFIKTLLGYLNGQTEDEISKRNDVSLEELNSVIEFWQSLAKLQDAASSLGILPEQVKGLQEIGVLKTVKLTSTLRYVEKKQIEHLLKKIAMLPEAGDRSPSVPLKRFCRSNRIAMEKVLEFWLSDENGCGFYRGNGRGLHQIVMDPDIIITRENTLLDGDLTIPETARFLKINVHAIRKLRNADYLQEIRRRNPDTNHIKGFITKASIQDFQIKFVTLGQAAEEKMIAANHLAQRLDQRGFEAIDCKSGYVRVYSASDWSKIKHLF